MRKVSYRIDGIQNQTQKTQLVNALDKLEGVQEVDIDRMVKVVNVEYNLPATESKIRDVIQSTGHDIIL